MIRSNKPVWTVMTALMLAMFAACFVSCSKDDDSGATRRVPDPEGTVVLNMMNASGEGTTIPGTSYIYIDRANNFYGGPGAIGYCAFVDLGPMRGLGNVTRFTAEGASRSCAVVPGHGYVAHYVWLDQLNPQAGQHQFPSGTIACNVQHLYRLYVEEWILGPSQVILGARVKYQPLFNPHGLPMTYEDFVSADPEAKGWEVDVYQDDYVTYYFVRGGETYTAFERR